MSERGFLARLMTDGESAAFVAGDWGRQVRHWPGALVPTDDMAINLNAFEDCVAGLNRAHEGWLHLADGGLSAVPPNFVRAEGLPDMRKLASAFAAGRTLYLTKAECVMAPLGRLCAGIEADLADHAIALRDTVNAHVFLTPPASQGFAPHRDAHASFIVQCEGRKHWRIYVPRESESEAHRAGSVTPEALAAHDVSEVTLERGDVLYMPEWWPHEAIASDVHSLHVTARVFPLRYSDLLTAIVADSATLADALPPGANLAGAGKSLLDRIGGGRFRAELERALPTAWKGAARYPTTPPPTGLLHRALTAETIELDTPLVRDLSLDCDVRNGGDGVVLAFADTAVRGPRPFRHVFAFVADHERFRPSDLPEIDAEYDRLEVSRRLVRDGLLYADGTQ